MRTVLLLLLLALAGCLDAEVPDESSNDAGSNTGGESPGNESGSEGTGSGNDTREPSTTPVEVSCDVGAAGASVQSFDLALNPPAPSECSLFAEPADPDDILPFRFAELKVEWSSSEPTVQSFSVEALVGPASEQTTIVANGNPGGSAGELVVSSNLPDLLGSTDVDISFEWQGATTGFLATVTVLLYEIEP